MIRLHDSCKTAIDEKSINTYGIVYLGISLLIGDFGLKLEYETNEARDKDIELLDKLFDAKDIEDKVESRVDISKDLLNSAITATMEECSDTKVEYATWDYVKQYATPIRVEMPNGDVKLIDYDNHFNGIICIYNGIAKDANGNAKDADACIYDEDLFNSLKLKVVR